MPSASTRSKMVGQARELVVGGPTGECIEGELGVDRVPVEDPLVGCVREGQFSEVGSRSYGWLSEKAARENAQHACGGAPQSRRARRPRVGPPACDARDRHF